MLGLLFGLTGFKDDTPVHWSHMLAVRNGVRDAGIGRKLKLYQRETLLARGIKHVFWSYDPLVARNAHLNVNSLGAEVTEYVPDMYGPGDDSVLFQGIGTDRFVVLWRIDSDKVREALTAGKVFDHAPYSTSPLAVSRSNEVDPLSAPLSGDYSDAPGLRVEIPPDIHSLRDLSVVAAARWREITRSAFQSCLKRGYAVTGFYRDERTGRCYYCLRMKE
jgi:predicted GNAT superfamily acetyltransferase